MEVLITILALFVSLFVGMIAGFYVASKFQFHVKIAKKEDYEEKIIELQKILDDLMAEPKDEGPSYRPYDMFPPNLDPEYGLPRSLKE